MSIDKELDTIRLKYQKLEQKLETDVLTPKKLLTYNTGISGFFKYGLQSLDNNGLYSSSTYYKPHETKTIEATETRRVNLNKALDNLLESFAETRDKNLEFIEHNKKVIERICIFMDTIGIPKTYYETDPKSRARVPKKLAKSAGYIQDISRTIPVNDSYNSWETKIKNKKLEVDKWAKNLKDSLSETIKLQQREEQEKKRIVVLATLRVKYDLPYDAEQDDILEHLLAKDKYLKLAHYMSKNREDWNDGSYYAEIGINSFIPVTDSDKQILESLTNTLDSYDGDGRIFRDCEWNYGRVYGLVDSSIMSDYEILMELKDFDDL